MGPEPKERRESDDENADVNRESGRINQCEDRNVEAHRGSEGTDKNRDACRESGRTEMDADAHRGGERTDRCESERIRREQEYSKRACDEIWMGRTASSDMMAKRCTLRSAPGWDLGAPRLIPGASGREAPENGLNLGGGRMAKGGANGRGEPTKEAQGQLELARTPKGKKMMTEGMKREQHQ